MKTLNKMELKQLKGGINLSGTLINSFATIIKALLDVGRNVGSSIRRIQEHQMCSIE